MRPTSDEVRDAAADDVRIGDVLLVRPSEIVPVDGVLLTESGTFDESSLTGESMPVSRAAGEEVLSGAVNGSRAVRIRAIRRSADSQYQQIVALVRDAQESRAPVVRLADRFAIPFTAVSLVIAGAAWGISGDPTRFAEVLVLATPCPLLIAAPVAFLGGLSRAAKAGIIIKGGAVIEQLARVRSAAFDKTGTLTQGRPDLVDVRAAAGFDADEVLRLAASAEQYSSHVLAEGIRARRGRSRTAHRKRDRRARGRDQRRDRDDRRAHRRRRQAGLHRLARPRHAARRPRPRPGGGLRRVDGAFAGVLVLADDVRAESPAVVEWLGAHGVEPHRDADRRRAGDGREHRRMRSASPRSTPSCSRPRRCIWPRSCGPGPCSWSATGSTTPPAKRLAVSGLRVQKATRSIGLTCMSELTCSAARFPPRSAQGRGSRAARGDGSRRRSPPRS